MILELDFKEFEKSGLLLEYFIVLQLLYNGADILKFKPQLSVECLDTLEKHLYIRKMESGSYSLRSKGKELFIPKVDINFDEFWDVFPTATPSGRILRATSKIWGNKPTRDYTVCKNKYLSKIKSIEAHKQVVTIVKARVTSKDYEYMNNMETYINQEKWQQDAKYLTHTSTQNSINKLV